MNAMCEHINATGRAFVEFTTPMLIQSAVLILILLGLDLILRRKVRAVVRYWMWMLVLLKLMLPTTLSLPTGLGYWLGDTLPEIALEKTPAAHQPKPQAPAPIIDTTKTVTVANPAFVAPPRDAGPSTTPPAPAKSEPALSPPRVTPAMTWQGLVFLTWLAVAAAMGLLLLQRAIFVRGLVAQSKEPDGLMNDAFELCRQQLNAGGKVTLKLSPNATSPAVCGLFRPVILIPHNLAARLSRRDLRAVFLHELAHIKRGDLWVNLAQTVLQILYFYNPLLWLANAIIRRIREQAVDETVLVAMGENARSYPQTLVNVARLAFDRPALSLRLIGVAESKDALAARIKRILNRPIPKHAKLGILGILAVILAAAVLLPMANEKPSIEALFEAASKGHAAKIKRLLDQGIDVTSRIEGEYPGTVLHAAVGNARVDCVKLLLERGAQVDAKNSQGETPLHLAARGSQYAGHSDRKLSDAYVEIARLLIDAGADVKARTEDGDTPLLTAARRLSYLTKSEDANPDFFRLLIACGADVDAATRMGGPALVFTVEGNRTDVARVLLEAGANPLANGDLRNSYHSVLEIAEQRMDGEQMGELLRPYVEAKMAKVKEAISQSIKELATAIRENDKQALMKVAVNHPTYGEGRWDLLSMEIRKHYEGHYELLDKMVDLKVVGAWADAFFVKPGGGEGEYGRFLLMEFPDGKWRVLEYEGDDARYSAGRLRAWRAELQKAAAEKYLEDIKMVVLRRSMPLPRLTAHKYYKAGDSITIKMESNAVDWKPTLEEMSEDDNAFFVLVNGEEYKASPNVGPFSGLTSWHRVPKIACEAAGKYRFAYGWKNVDVVSPEEPDKVIHFGRLITDEAEFEVVDDVPDGYYQQTYQDGWEDSLQENLLPLFTDDMRKHGVSGPLLALKIRKLPFDIAFEIYAQAEGSDEEEPAGQIAIRAGSYNHITGCDRNVKGLTWDNVGDRRWRLILKPSQKVAASHPPIHRYYGREFVTDWLTFERSERFDYHRRRAKNTNNSGSETQDSDVTAAILLPMANEKPSIEALFEAASKGHAAKIKKLLDKGIDVNSRIEGEYSGTVLHTALANASVDCVKLLLERGAQVNAKNPQGETPLHLAARGSQYTGHSDRKLSDAYVEIARLLIDAGADVKARAEDGDTPLLTAARRLSYLTKTEDANPDFFKLLIACGADVDAATQIGGPALVFAVEGNRTDIARILLQAGANPLANGDLRNSYHSVLEIAEHRMDGEQMAELLRPYVEAKMAKVKEAISQSIKELATAVRENDKQALMKVAVNHPTHGEGTWDLLSREIRKHYEGHYDLLDKMVDFNVVGAWADAFFVKPGGGEGEYGRFLLMEFPDGKWRVLEYEGDDARYSAGRLRAWRAELEKAAAETAAKDTTRCDFTASLPNGVSVELLGVCEYPSEGKQWWRPDGAALKEAPIHEKSDRPLRVAFENPFEFALRVTCPNEGSFSVAAEVEPPGKQATALIPIKQNEGTSLLLGPVKEGLDAANLRVGIAAGDFDATVVCDVNDTASGKGRVGDIVFSAQQGRRGRLNVTVSGALGSTDCTLVLVDSSGDEHNSDRSTASYEGSRIDQCTFSFRGTGIADIRQYRLKMRKHRWVTFKNISLKPNFKTDVQVEVAEELRGSKGLAFRIVPFSVTSGTAQGPLTAEQEQGYRSHLKEYGPDRPYNKSNQYIWLPVGEDVITNTAITGEFEEQKYVLVSNKPDETMLYDGSWYVNFVDRKRDNEWAAKYHSVVARFDEYGTHLFSSLTNNHIGRNLAVVNDGKVVFASTIQRREYQAAITGDFTQKQTARWMGVFEKYLQVKEERAPFLWDVNRQVWRDYVEATEALAKGQERAKLAKTLLTIGSKYPQTTQCQTATELGQLLEIMAKEDEQFEEPEDIQALSRFRQVEYYIFKLRDVAEKDIFVPGEIRFLRDYPRIDTPVVGSLRKMGRDVVPMMIKHLRDRRPTRSVGSLLNGGVVIRNCDVALEIIESIAGRKFDFRTSRGTYLSTASERLRDRIIEDVEKWWQQNRPDSDTEVEVVGDSGRVIHIPQLPLIKQKEGVFYGFGHFERRPWDERVGTFFSGPWQAVTPDNGVIRLLKQTALRLSITSDNNTELAALDAFEPDDLQVLALPLSNKIDSRAMPHIGRLTGLRALFLGGAKIKDEDLNHLLDLKALTALHLQNCPLTDQAAEILAKMKTLKHLNLWGTAVTQQGYQRLAEALPECNIQWKEELRKPTIKTDVEVETAWERASQMMGAALPESVENVKSFSASFEASIILCRFDIPKEDLKVLLEKSKRFPEFSRFVKNPELENRWAEYRYSEVDWWRPEELKEPVYGQWRASEKAPGAEGKVWVVQFVDIACGELANDLMRVYLQNNSHGHTVEHDAEVDGAVDQEYRKALLEAAEKGRANTVRQLLKRGGAVHGGAALLKAAESVYDRADPDVTMQNYVEIATLLIEAGADVNYRDRQDATPLLRAASSLVSYEHKSVNTDFFRLLIENGADVNAACGDPKRELALTSAVRADNLELAEMLLEAGADPLAAKELSGRDRTVLEIARDDGSKEMVELLAKYAEPGLEDLKKRLEGTLKAFVEAVTTKDDEALMQVTGDRHGKDMWLKRADKIRTDYEGHYELLDQMLSVGQARGFASVVFAKPESSEQKYSKLWLMKFPDGKWRVLGYLGINDGPEDAFEWARRGYEMFYRYQKAVFDAAGRLEEVAPEIPTGMYPEMPYWGGVTLSVADGSLWFDFFGEPEGQYRAVQVLADRVKHWRGESNLGVARKLTMEKGDLKLHAENGKATLSARGKQYVIDAHEGRVRVQAEGKVLTGDRFTFELPTLDLQQEKRPSSRTGTGTDVQVEVEETPGGKES
jgi:ankyrin repeat protein